MEPIVGESPETEPETWTSPLERLLDGAADIIDDIAARLTGEPEPGPDAPAEPSDETDTSPGEEVLPDPPGDVPETVIADDNLPTELPDDLTEDMAGAVPVADEPGEPPADWDETVAELKEQITAELTDQLEAEIREEVTAEIRDDLAEEIKAEVIEDLQAGTEGPVDEPEPPDAPGIEEPEAPDDEFVGLIEEIDQFIGEQTGEESTLLEDYLEATGQAVDTGDVPDADLVGDEAATVAEEDQPLTDENGAVAPGEDGTQEEYPGDTGGEPETGEDGEPAPDYWPSPLEDLLPEDQIPLEYETPAAEDTGEVAEPGYEEPEPETEPSAYWPGPLDDVPIEEMAGLEEPASEDIAGGQDLVPAGPGPGDGYLDEAESYGDQAALHGEWADWYHEGAEENKAWADWYRSQAAWSAWNQDPDSAEDFADAAERESNDARTLSNWSADETQAGQADESWADQNTQTAGEMGSDTYDSTGGYDTGSSSGSSSSSYDSGSSYESDSDE
jgi:hypothetical protein